MTGQELFERRVTMHLSREKLARLSGVCLATIQHYENGKTRRMHPFLLKSIEDALTKCEKMQRREQEAAAPQAA